MTLSFFLGIFLAYMLGSIPTAVWIGIVFHGIDVREHGSGNAGATNVIRVLGPRAGLPVLLFDVFKAWLAVYLANFFAPDYYSQNQIVNFKIACGAIAVLGHVFPLFANFKGGKGVASLVGVSHCISNYLSMVYPCPYLNRICFSRFYYQLGFIAYIGNFGFQRKRFESHYSINSDCDIYSINTSKEHTSIVARGGIKI